MSIRSSAHYPEIQAPRKFVCSPLGSAVPGQCHCCPAMNCSCGPNNPSDPLMYFRYSDCNVVTEHSEDEDCHCQPCQEQSVTRSHGTSRCRPKRPIHMQMSCSGSPTAADWKRFHDLKREWAREKNRKGARRSVCSASCQLPHPLHQKHGAADEVCAQVLGIPACAGGGAVPILDPDSWRVARVMTSAATCCPRCCTDEPVSVDVNFGVQYCGPSPSPAQPPLPYDGDASSYMAALSQKTRFDVPYRPSEDMSHSLIRRPTPFPGTEIDLGGNADRISQLGSVGQYPGSVGQYPGSVGQYPGSYVGGGSRQPSYQDTGQQSFLGSVYSKPGSVRTRLGSGLPNYSQIGSTLSNVQHSYREPEPSVLVDSGESFCSSDSANSGGRLEEDDGRSRYGQERSLYSRAEPSVYDPSVRTSVSRRSQKSHKSRFDGRSVKSRGNYTINTEGGRSTYTTRTNAKSHRSQRTLKQDPTLAGSYNSMEGEPSTFTTRTNAKSHRSQRTLKQDPTLAGSYNSMEGEPSTFTTRTNAKSHRSQRTLKQDPTLAGSYNSMDGEPSTFTTRTNAKSHRSQRTLKQDPTLAGSYNSMEGEPSTFTTRTNAKSHRSQRTLAPSNKSRIDGKSHYSHKTYQGEPSVYTIKKNTKSQRFQQPFDNELKKKIPGKSYVSFHHTVKNGSGHRSRNFGGNKSKRGIPDKSNKSVATRRGGNLTDSESDDSDEGDVTTRHSPSSVVTVIKVSDHLASEDFDSPVSQANKSHKSRKSRKTLQV